MSKKMYLLPGVLFLLFIIVFVVFLKVDLDIGDYEYVTVKYVASLSFSYLDCSVQSPLFCLTRIESQLNLCP